MSAMAFARRSASWTLFRLLQCGISLRLWRLGAEAPRRPRRTAPGRGRGLAPRLLSVLSKYDATRDLLSSYDRGTPLRSIVMWKSKPRYFGGQGTLVGPPTSVSASTPQYPSRLYFEGSADGRLVIPPGEPWRPDPGPSDSGLGLLRHRLGPAAPRHLERRPGPRSRAGTGSCRNPSGIFFIRHREFFSWPWFFVSGVRCERISAKAK